VKIVVLVKHVPSGPDTLAYATDRTVDRAAGPGRLDEGDEIAVDQAVRIARHYPDARITALTMGPAPAAAALARALVLGADEGVHVLDDHLHGSDALATSRVLAAAIARLDADLVLCGAASADSGTSAVPPMVGERLGFAVLGRADRVTVGPSGVEIRRDDGGGVEVVAAERPAVVSVTARCGPPRYPTFVARAAARHKPVRIWSLADLGIDPSDVGLAGAATVVRSVAPRPIPAARPVIADDPAGAAVRLADFLAERQFL